MTTLHPQKTTWVLIADEAIARILQRSADAAGLLDSVEEITDPDAHALGSELRRDAQGRRAGSAPHGAQADTAHRLRSGASVTASAGEAEQHEEARQFAKRVADHLAQALQQRRFDQLQIVAAPRFLGLLRQAISPQVQHCVIDELNKDFVHLENDDIAQRLQKAGLAATTAR